MHVNHAAHVDDERAQIIDAMGVIGMIMREQHGIEMAHIRRKQLLAQIRRCVDQDARSALAGDALHKERAAATAILRVGRIARTPA